MLCGIRTSGRNLRVQGIHVDAGVKRVSGDASLGVGLQADEIMVLIVLQGESSIGIEGTSPALSEAAEPAIEAVSVRIPPEVGHECRIIKGVLVQLRQRRFGLVADGRSVRHNTVQSEGPILLCIQWRGIIRRKAGCHTRLLGIDRDGIKDAIRIVPAGKTDGRGIQRAIHIDHQRGKLLLIVPLPVASEIRRRIRLQVHVAKAQSRRISDVQYRQHPGRIGASSISGGIERNAVAAFAVLESHVRRDKPIPFTLSGIILNTETLGISLVQDT